MRALLLTLLYVWVTSVVGAGSFNGLTPLGWFQVVAVWILSRDTLAKNRPRVVTQILGILVLTVLLNLQNTFTDESCSQRNNLAQRQALNLKPSLWSFWKLKKCIISSVFDWLGSSDYWTKGGLLLDHKYLFSQCDTLLLIKWNLIMTSIR